MNIPPYGDTFRRALMPFANLKVRAQNVPNMTVYVSPGGFGIILLLERFILNLLVEIRV